MILTTANDISILLLLLAGHAFADFPLSGDIFSKGKKNTTVAENLNWFHTLTIHSSMHGGIVFLITQSTILGISEFIIHWVTDYLKYHGYISVNTDQTIHVVCKIMWWVLWLTIPAKLLGQIVATTVG